MRNSQKYLRIRVKLQALLISMMVVVGHSHVQLQTGNYRIRLISVGLGYFITVILCRVNWCCNTED